MAFESLHESRLYPLYSDMENSDTENRLSIPSPIRRRRRRLKASTPPRTRNIPHFHPMIAHPPSFTPNINTLSPLSALSHSKRRRNKGNKTIPKALEANKRPRNTKRRQRPKRRIRTFYSKKWGNKLYGLTGNHPSKTESDRDRDRDTDVWRHNESFDDEPSVSPYDYDSAVSNVAANTDDEAIDRFCTLDDNDTADAPFKIIVSGPDVYNYIPSDNESATDLSSSDDDSTIMHRSSLFLSGNNMNIGVYSDFGLTTDASDTDYMSAQSGDFDELTVCYKKNEKNIRFRDNYLNDIGPSDIGSSDTDYFSSADSIPDSIPDSIDDTMQFML